jgi:hypothetical protein
MEMEYMLPPLSNWNHAFDSVIEALEEQKGQYQSSMVIKRRALACASRLKTSGHTDGDARYKKINEMLDQCGMKRTDYQRQFHHMGMMACVPHIYGKDYDMCRSRIMKTHGLKEFRSEVLVVTPRRYGKTTMVAMFVAVLLLVVAGIKICIFSTGKRSSGTLLNMITTFIHILHGEKRIVKHNQEELFVGENSLDNGLSDKSHVARENRVLESTSTLRSYPASEKGFFSLSLS